MGTAYISFVSDLLDFFSGIYSFYSGTGYIFKCKHVEDPLVCWFKVTLSQLINWKWLSEIKDHSCVISAFSNLPNGWWALGYETLAAITIWCLIEDARFVFSPTGIFLGVLVLQLSVNEKIFERNQPFFDFHVF